MGQNRGDIRSRILPWYARFSISTMGTILPLRTRSNVVMNRGGAFVELRDGEGHAFRREELDELLNIAANVSANPGIADNRIETKAECGGRANACVLQRQKGKIAG